MSQEVLGRTVPSSSQSNLRSRALKSTQKKMARKVLMPYQPEELFDRCSHANCS